MISKTAKVNLACHRPALAEERVWQKNDSACTLATASLLNQLRGQVSNNAINDQFANPPLDWIIGHTRVHEHQGW